MFRHERTVRWSDVDAAGLVFFPKFLEYCHDAIEAMFGALPGGYPTLTMQRRIGVPTVHVDVDYRAPLRYGDTCVIELSVRAIGRTSVTFGHRLVRAADGVVCADVTHVIAVSDLDAMRATPIPDDVRAVLATHLASS